MVPVNDGASPAPIDRSVLERIQSRFARSQTVETAKIVEEDNLHLRVALSDDYYLSARRESRRSRRE